MDIQTLANQLAKFEGITRKYPISDVILPLNELLKEKNPVLEIIGSFGEDSAILKVAEASESHYFLLAMDGMWSKLIEADPELAGYFGVLVNVNDITCKGGIPIALLDMLAYQDAAIGKRIVRGMAEGAQKFGVPIVGGHLHPRNDYDSLTLAIFGIVPKAEVILSSSAQGGDDVIVAIDLDGHVHDRFPYAWDTTSHKTPAQIRAQSKIMRTLAARQLVHAAKDISNPGIVGTLGMLLDASKKGGILDIKKLPSIAGVSFERWLCMYPGFGNVLTCDPQNSEEIVSIFIEGGVSATICGEVRNTNTLSITDGEEEATVLNFQKDFISGVPR